MPTKAEVLALVDELTGSIENLGADLTRTIEENADNIPQEVFDKLKLIADRAKALSQIVPEPPVEEPEEPTEPEA